MATWKVTPPDGVTGSNGTYTFPANNSTTEEKSYTISYTSDTNCTASMTYTIPKKPVEGCISNLRCSIVRNTKYCGCSSETLIQFDYDGTCSNDTISYTVGNVNVGAAGLQCTGTPTVFTIQANNSSGIRVGGPFQSCTGNNVTVKCWLTSNPSISGQTTGKIEATGSGSGLRGPILYNKSGHYLKLKNGNAVFTTNCDNSTCRAIGAQLDATVIIAPNGSYYVDDAHGDWCLFTNCRGCTITGLNPDYIPEYFSDSACTPANKTGNGRLSSNVVIPNDCSTWTITYERT